MVKLNFMIINFYSDHYTILIQYVANNVALLPDEKRQVTLIQESATGKTLHCFVKMKTLSKKVN